MMPEIYPKFHGPSFLGRSILIVTFYGKKHVGAAIIQPHEGSTGKAAWNGAMRRGLTPATGHFWLGQVRTAGHTQLL